MSNLIGQRLGDFEIVREIGRGGMGIVYEARQVSLNRKVALKVLSGGLGLTGKAVRRFRREAEAAAKLHHTNIVPVYATGEEGGTHFYAMELIDGPSLDHVIRQMRVTSRKAMASGEPGRASAGSARGADATPLTSLEATGPYVHGAGLSGAAAGLGSSSLSSGTSYFDTVARMVAEVADALEYAHQEGVIHRDMKPSNLLLSPTGRLSVNDFGLARLLEQPGMTLTGEFVGTPAYMSPEQITAGRTPLDHRTDIYSLGATLYELLTLYPPFSGKQRDQVLAQILHKEPKAPRKAHAKVPVDLETICLKALEKDPDRRYQSAGAMADDLRRYVNRFAISARRAGPMRRLVKWVRRRPAVAASLGGLLLAVALALAFAYRAHQEKQQRLLAVENARLQLLDEKIHSAYLIATSGDLKRTDEAIKEIETLGASTGQVRLLRGMVAFFRQDSEHAISDLEQAVKLLPDSVAARALLIMSSIDYGLYEQCFALFSEMERLSPSSTEDFLFKGYAGEAFGSERTLADVNEGIRRRDSPLGRALRAFILANRAIDSAKLADAKAALRDADVARELLPNNQLTLYTSVYTQLVAAAIYQEAGLTEKRTAVMEGAGRDVQALEPFIDLPNPAWISWQYFVDSGQPERALEVARRSLERSGNPIAAFFCAVSLYRQGKFMEALQCLERRRHADPFGDITRGFILAGLTDGPRRILDEYDALARTYPNNVHYLGYLLLFLGKKEQALPSLQSITALDAAVPERKEFRDLTRRFYRGELSEDEFVAKVGTSRWKQSTAHFEIALFRLADGDRAGAREHFAQVVRLHTIWDYFRSPWSLVFLERLENDPKWPPWIPMKK